MKRKTLSYIASLLLMTEIQAETTLINYEHTYIPIMVGDIMTFAKTTPKYDSDQGVKAYFGDKLNNLIDIVDIGNMSLIERVATGHQITYAAEAIRTKITDKNGIEKFYIDNRGSNAIDVLDAKTNTIIKTISLNFYPRSIDINKKTGYVVVSGKNKTMASVIDTTNDRVLLTVGDTATTTSTGHPKWLDNNHFVILDREHNQLLTYAMSEKHGTFKGTLLNTLKTYSPVHNIIPPEVHGQAGHKHGTKTSQIFFATEEGSSSIYGSVLKLEFLKNIGLTQLERLEIDPVSDQYAPRDTGVHHHNFLKNQKNIYVGSKEGVLTVVDYTQSPMRVVKTIAAGKGAGHTAEFPKNNIAVVINHTDKFVTLVNTLTHTKIADIQVSNIPSSEVGIVQTQSHPEYHFSKDGKYFYLFLTEEGDLVKIDLDAQKVVQRLKLGGHLSMGSFIESK